jgi:hypothetical protein
MSFSRKAKISLLGLPGSGLDGNLIVLEEGRTRQPMVGQGRSSRLIETSWKDVCRS